MTFDDFERQPLLPQKYSQLGPGAAWGDVDGDGDDDVFIGQGRGFAGRLYYNENGEFEGRSLDCFKSTRTARIWRHYFLMQTAMETAIFMW